MISLSDIGIDGIYTGGFDSDKYLSLTDNRNVHFFQFQDTLIPVFSDHDCFHKSILRIFPSKEKSCGPRNTRKNTKKRGKNLLN